MQAEGVNQGENRRGNGSRSRHTARGAEISGGSWRLVGVGDVQVDGATIQERRWGGGAIERFCNNQRLLVGAR